MEPSSPSTSLIFSPCVQKCKDQSMSSVWVLTLAVTGRGGAGRAVPCLRVSSAVHCSGERGAAGPVTQQTDTFPASLPGIVQLRTNAADCNQSNYKLFQINLNFGFHVGAEVKQQTKILLFYFFRYWGVPVTCGLNRPGHCEGATLSGLDTAGWPAADTQCGQG